jgi:DegT/DnrJ/EryC1/StrS aminotransferase family
MALSARLYRQQLDFIDRLVHRVLREAEIAKATGARHAIAVCNGTVALYLALHGLGIGTGDEVIVPSFTYIASVNTIAQTGGTPVFAESRASDWLLDPADVEGRITSRAKAIMPGHRPARHFRAQLSAIVRRRRGESRPLPARRCTYRTAPSARRPRRDRRICRFCCKLPGRACDTHGYERLYPARE